MNKWRKYNHQMGLREGSDCFWQKRIKTLGESHISAEIVQYTSMDSSLAYELEIQIPEEFSITGMTININNFAFKKLDFKKMEKIATKIIDKLTNTKRNNH